MSRTICVTDDTPLEKDFDSRTALAEASRCLLCHDAPCSEACPAGDVYKRQGHCSTDQHVHCRIGSLEVENRRSICAARVHCRIGSLEELFLTGIL